MSFAARFIRISRYEIPIPFDPPGGCRERDQLRQRDNQIIVVIGNGPFAGTYHADSPICMRAKTQDVFGAGWKDFNAKGDKAFAEAGLGVYAPDLPGPTKGRADVAFGEDKKKVAYHFSPVPVTLEVKGKGGIIRFDGTTPEGIKVHIEAICTEVESV